MRVTSQRTQNQSPGRGRIRSKRGNRKQQDERLEGRKGSESARQNEDERERVGEGDRGVMAIERSRVGVKNSKKPSNGDYGCKGSEAFR